LERIKSGLKSNRILIADDNPDMIYLIKRGFKDDDYVFLEAHDGEAALQKIETEKPDLILLDLKMPKKNGMDVLRELKEMKGCRDIPVIILTVVADPLEKIKALEYGARDFLVKPPGSAELRARVNTQLELRKATKTLKKYSEHLEKTAERKTKKLKEYASRLEEMVEQKVGLIKRQNEEIMVSLRSAQKVQKSLLPTGFPNLKGLKFESLYYPLEAVGGDIYNVFRIDEDTIGMFLADVSGHGIPSAMIAIFLKQEVTHQVKRIIGKGNYIVERPKDVLKNLNDSFIQKNIGEGLYFVTMVYGLYSLSKKELVLSSAGHHALPMIRRSSGEIEVAELIGFPIGWFSDTGEYEEKNFRMHPGDSVFFYTDGLFELFPAVSHKTNFAQMLNPIMDIFKSGNTETEINKRINRSRKSGKRKLDDITLLMMHIQ
jgi:sigma-B regulation protein RsbU (phosphoserine phosphatase)